ncbi:hypothetical protein A4H97_19320 [Niastella yeongjuensis]|uniref:DUF4595 domain-containing protein n=1 Tax=Niastella yeongjuensis TaxID=354355 RepID=A0A1V9DYF7_9BACT|nr:hypothetical protein [Niastella yeongjuensis]OQP38861.1 hypothetical protein A4H97_19320 [Niastella yeongjuensis]SEO29899.1 hypothetical protein SAMN05660816_02538 [Niastella yeongjuensis]
MNRCLLVFASLMCLVLFSCHKSGLSDNDNTNPNDTIPADRTWFKLKTIVSSRVSATNSYYAKDSMEISIDSVNRKVICKDYNSSTYTRDTATTTFTYNSNYQLALYENVTSYRGFDISRMEFVRDASGQVAKVISGYKNGLVATSEGSVKYDKRGDTTFITYLDSVKKNPGYYDGQDYFQVALVGGKPVFKKYFPIPNAEPDSIIDKYEYDASGNLATTTEILNQRVPEIYTYQRSGETPKELQKFMAQWIGDLFWYSRAKQFFPFITIGTESYEGYILGNVVQTIKKDNVVLITYTNTFDASGNLTSISYQGIWEPHIGIYTTAQRYYYRP